MNRKSGCYPTGSPAPHFVCTALLGAKEGFKVSCQLFVVSRMQMTSKNERTTTRLFSKGFGDRVTMTGCLQPKGKRQAR